MSCCAVAKHGTAANHCGGQDRIRRDERTSMARRYVLHWHGGLLGPPPRCFTDRRSQTSTIGEHCGNTIVRISNYIPRTVRRPSDSATKVAQRFRLMPAMVPPIDFANKGNPVRAARSKRKSFQFHGRRKPLVWRVVKLEMTGLTHHRISAFHAIFRQDDVPEPNACY